MAECVLYEKLVQLFVGGVYDELLEAVVVRQVLKARDVQQPDAGVPETEDIAYQTDVKRCPSLNQRQYMDTCINSRSVEEEEEEEEDAKQRQQS